MKIGLSQQLVHSDGILYDATEHGWYELLKGHSLFFIPNTLNQDFDLMANDLDSFIIASGTGDSLCREVELHMATKMTERGKPVVGVCQGAFLLAEMLGGTITDIKNHDIDHPIFYHREVREVNSHHSRAISSLPDSINVLCRDYLGNVEAFADGNVAGIVWHPQRMKEPWIPPEIAYMLRV